MALSGEWVRVGPASEIVPTAIVGVDDADAVVWRTLAGRWCASDARCPHQWSHLAAEGVVDGEELVCAAHGWRFDPEGRATKLAMNGRRDPKAPIEVLDCVVAEDEVYVRRRTATKSVAARDGDGT